MRIGHGRDPAGRRRRVTFETAKWEAVLERMGHEVRLCAGEVDALRSTARLVPAMHFTHPPAARVTAAAFDPDSDAEAVAHEIQRLADQLLPVLDAWVETERLELLIVENAWAIPMQLPLGVALRRWSRRPGCRHQPQPRLLVGARAVRRRASCPRS